MVYQSTKEAHILQVVFLFKPAKLLVTSDLFWCATDPGSAALSRIFLYMP